MKRTSRHQARIVSANHGIKRNKASTGSSVEALESRVFLSGTVLASVVHGNLTIQGDNAANAVVLDQAGLSAGQVRVSGAGGTTINHQTSPVILSGVTRAVNIQMGKAADSVTLHGLILPGNLSINDHGGADNIAIDNTTVGKNLTIDAGSGGQSIVLQAVDVRRNTKIARGGGRASAVVTIDDSTFHGATQITTGDGADLVQIDARGNALGAPTVFGGPVLIALNSGDDTLQLGVPGQTGNRVVFGRKVRLDGDAGRDTLRNFDVSTFSPKTKFDIKSFEIVATSSTDTIAPTVLSSNPANGDGGVALNSKVVATFSEAMDPRTITSANVSLTAADGTVVSGTVGYIGNAMTFAPDSPLSASTIYTLTITNGAEDLAGNPLAGTFVTAFTTGNSLDTTAPTVLSTDPVNLQTNVAINKTIVATFDKSIDPLTLTSTTFTLKAPGNASVAGAVNYDEATKTASLTPSSSLAPNTTFTATIKGGVNGAKDLAGNPLANDDVWTFTTGAQAAQAKIQLGRAAPFAVMATASISSTGSTQINGDVGLNPGSSQGIPPAQVSGTIHVDDQAIIDAQSDLLAAYNDAVSRTVTSVSLPGNMGGLTFTPGLYTNSTSVMIQGAGPNNNVTLDAQGDPNAIFIFKMGSTLTTGPGAQVILAGGAKASNIFWQVGTSATLNTTTIFKGNILAAVTITVNNGSDIVGRLLAGSNSDGSVTVNGSTVTVPVA
jgi:hypothetical protein